MNHVQLFIASLINPKQLAATRALSIGKVIQYAFLLITLLSLFSVGQFVTQLQGGALGTEGLEEYLATIEWLIYPVAFIMIFLMMAALVFLRISIYAAVGLLFIKLLQRRGAYRQVWRTATYTITWATLLSIVIEMTSLSGTALTVIGILMTLLFLYIAIQYYPKMKK